MLDDGAIYIKALVRLNTHYNLLYAVNCDSVWTLASTSSINITVTSKCIIPEKRYIGNHWKSYNV